MSKRSNERSDRDRDSLPILGIEASASSDELKVQEAARVKVRFTGRGKVVTRRKNLPPQGAESGQAYRDATSVTRIHALSPSVERAGDERAGNVRGEGDGGEEGDESDRSGSERPVGGGGVARGRLRGEGEPVPGSR